MARRGIWAALALLVVGLLVLLLRDDPDREETGVDTVAVAPPPAPRSGTRQAAAPLPRTQPTASLPHAIREPAPDRPFGEFVGQVVSWTTGAGVPDAELSFSIGGALATAVSDKDGVFRFAPATSELHRLATVSARGYLPFAPTLSQSPIQLVPRAGVRVTGLRVTLFPAITYTGYVRTTDGTAVNGASIEISANSEQALLPIDTSFESDEDGRFEFSAPDFAILEAEAPDGAFGRAVLDGAVQVSHSVTITVSNQRPERATIQGHVIALGGDPVAGAKIRAFAAAIPPAETVSDENGAFEISVVRPHGYNVTAEAPGYAPAFATGSPGTEGLELLLLPAASIRGRVRTPDGEPVPAFSIVVERKTGPLARQVVAVESVFNADGEFVVEGLREASYEVSASSQKYARSAPVSAQASLTEGPAVVLTMQVGGSVKGIVSGGDGQPLEGARVTLEGEGAQGSSAQPVVRTQTTDRDGRFLIEGIRPGRRSLFAAAFQHNSTIASGIDIQAGDTAGPVEIRLTPVAAGQRPKLELAGIGAQLSPVDDGLKVSKVFPDSGAEAGGLLADDVIIGVAGTTVLELGFQGAIQAIRGPVGSTVRLTIRRGENSLTLDVPRKKIQV